MNYIASKRLFLTADQKRVVEFASHEAGYLFRGVGQTISEAEAKKYNLIGTDMISPLNPQTEAEVSTTPETKAVTEVPMHKAVLEVPEKKAPTPKKKGK